MAVVATNWVWDGSCGTVDEGESFVEIWAVLELLDLEVWKSWSIVWELVILHQSPTVLAIVSLSWISNSSGGTVNECKSLVKVWASLELLDFKIWKSWSIVWEVVAIALGKAI